MIKRAILLGWAWAIPKGVDNSMYDCMKKCNI